MRTPLPRVLLVLLTALSCGAQVVGSGPELGSDLSLKQKAEAGDVGAQYEMGIEAREMHQYRESFKWLERAASQGLSAAEVDLAYSYITGFGTDKDPEKAVHWYSLAAAQANPDAEFSLAMCYLHGEGVEQNLTLARKWISSAIMHGDRARSTNAMGLTYEVGPEVNLDEAFSWYNKAAEMGYNEAQYSVCRLTAQGFVSPTDYQHAISWCSILGNKGDVWGEYGMGRICEEGIGVPPDPGKAAEWYKKAADQGNPSAQLRLAGLYAEGKGIKQNLAEAYKWAAVASVQKNPEALEFFKSLTAQMNQTQLAAGQSLARKWLQENPLDPDSSVSIDHILYNKP